MQQVNRQHPRTLATWLCLAAAVLVAAPSSARAQAAPPPPAAPAAPAAPPPAADAPAPAATASAPESSASDMPPEGNGIFGSSNWGTRGAYRVISARPLVPGGVVLTISDEYFSIGNVFVQGDTDQQSTQRMRIIWSPVLGLEIGLAQLSTVNKYFDLLPRTFQVQGNPSIMVKYARSIIPEVGVGAHVDFMVPTSEFGAGLTPGAFTLKLNALVSYQPVRWFELSANIGYIIDQSSQLFPNVQADRQQSFVYEVNQLDRLNFGLAGVFDFTINDTADLAPYLEFSGNYGSTPSAGDNPLRATVGLKAFPTHSRAVEGSLGADIRLGGQPMADSPYGGIPPWTFFGQLTVHLFESLDQGNTTTVIASAASCQADNECSAGQSCLGNVCTATKEVVVEKEVVKEVVKEAPTFLLAGGVFDEATGEPVPYANVYLSGAESVLAVDQKAGTFTSWPITVGEGLVQVKVKAPGYLEAEQTVPKGAAGETKQVVFKLKGDSSPQFGTLKGTLKDAKTGQPLADAKIFIPVLKKRISTKVDGSFEEQLKVGRYQVLINAKKYITQKKDLNIKNGDVLIWNIDLRPKKGKKGG